MNAICQGAHIRYSTKHAAIRSCQPMQRHGFPSRDMTSQFKFKINTRVTRRVPHVEPIFQGICAKESDEFFHIPIYMYL